MKDKYTLTREESVFLAKKRWDESIYSGMRMESRNVTFPQTQTILNGVNVPDVALGDIQAILNMRDAWEYLLDHLDDALDIDYLCRLQERIAYREALAWGELRTGSIGISGVDYVLPVPDEKAAARELRDMLDASGSATEKALSVFAWVARSQLFWDGNKRTATLAANKILIESGAGMLLVSERDMVEFAALLSSYYESGRPEQLKQFLYESCILGIGGIPEQDDMPEKGSRSKPKSHGSAKGNGRLGHGPTPQRTTPMTPAKRTAAWLKAERKERKVTQRQLGEAVGLSTSAIANIEQRQRKGSDETWERIERYLESYER